MGPRRELGVRTAFNLLGPLTNPAQPEAQLVGVPRPELTVFMARCLKRLGARRGWVVHGDGLDELTPCGATRVTAFDDFGIQTFSVEPESAGLSRCAKAELAGGDAAASAAIARDVLAGSRGARRDAVLLNAAAALVVAGRARDLKEAAVQAAAALDDGRAAHLLARATELSRS